MEHFRGCQLSIVAAKAALEMTVEKDIPKIVKQKELIVKEYLEKEIKPLLDVDANVSIFFANSKQIRNFF